MSQDLKPIKIKFTKCGETCGHYRPDYRPSDIGTVLVDAWCAHPNFEKPKRCGVGPGFPVFCPLDDWKLEVIEGGRN